MTRRELQALKPDPGTSRTVPTRRKGVVTSVDPLEVRTDGNGGLPAVNVSGQPVLTGDVVWLEVEQGRRLLTGTAHPDPVVDVAEVVSGTASELFLAVPSGMTACRVVGTLNSDAAGTSVHLGIRVNGIIATNAYRWDRRTWIGGATTPTSPGAQVDDATILAGTIVPGTSANSHERGEIELVIANVDNGRPKLRWDGSVIPTTSASDWRQVHGHGRVAAAPPLHTLRFAVAGGNFTAGTRLELRRA